MAASVTIMTSGARIESEEVCGKTIAEVRSGYADTFNIPSAARPLVNGRSVEESYILKPNDELSFSKATGSKG